MAANHLRLLIDYLNIEEAHILRLSLRTIVQQYFSRLFPEKIISLVHASPITKTSIVSTAFNGISDKVFLTYIKSKKQ